MNCGEADIPDDVLRVSVRDLVATFREGLIALIPTADRLMLQWRDEYQHRHWENLAEAVFDAYVRGPIVTDVRRRNDEYLLPRYDIDHPSYVTNSWIGVGGTNCASPAALVRLLTDQAPFDTVQVACLDPDALVPLARPLLPFEGLDFFLIRRSPAEPDQRVNEIESDD